MELPAIPLQDGAGPSSRRHFSASVRELAEFLFRTGNLGGSGAFAGVGRALEGTRGHQRVQRRAPAGYEAEVFLQLKREFPLFELVLSGRVDGLLRDGSSVLLEEIKTVPGDLPPIAAVPWHWAQAKLYAGLLLDSEPGLAAITLRLTYLALGSDEVRAFEESPSLNEIRDFRESAIAEYGEWLEWHAAFLNRRDESLRALAFPFKEYRRGQRELAVAAYRALKGGKTLFAEAPTGLGKTMAMLYPALKRLIETDIQAIFYLTAKTPGRLVAEKAVAELRAAGLSARTLTLTAREKICFRNPESPSCDPQSCPFTIGYYDRIKPALRELLTRETLDRSAVEEIARKHTVCPFELSLDASLWADLIIADYNYAFDPRASLKRFFAAEPCRVILLVDEAHNLVERAREMFSAELDGAEVTRVRQLIRRAVPKCGRACSRIVKLLRTLEMTPVGAAETVLSELPPELGKLLDKAVETAEEWLARNEPADFRADLLDFYFSLHAFRTTAASASTEHVVLLKEREGARTIRLFCVNPGPILKEQLARVTGALFFSATLAPLEFYADVLGGADRSAFLALPSPFPPEHLEVRVNPRIATNFKQRDATNDQLAQAISAFLADHDGNTLVYFPSYKYLGQVLEALRAQAPELDLETQTPGMSEDEREAFLEKFRDPARRTIGFALMGGLFGEGIDLGGAALSNVIIVGVGLPQICLERECIRRCFQERNRRGFEYAYLFPGMNRVIQAVGRLIRSETDRGRALLIDTRFAEFRYRKLFPEWWHASREGSPQ